MEADLGEALVRGMTTTESPVGWAFDLNRGAIGFQLRHPDHMRHVHGNSPSVSRVPGKGCVDGHDDGKELLGMICGDITSPPGTIVGTLVGLKDRKQIRDEAAGTFLGGMHGLESSMTEERYTYLGLQPQNQEQLISAV